MMDAETLSCGTPIKISLCQTLVFHQPSWRVEILSNLWKKFSHLLDRIFYRMLRCENKKCIMNEHQFTQSGRLRQTEIVCIRKFHPGYANEIWNWSIHLFIRSLLLLMVDKPTIERDGFENWNAPRLHCWEHFLLLHSCFS